MIYKTTVFDNLKRIVTPKVSEFIRINNCTVMVSNHVSEQNWCKTIVFLFPKIEVIQLLSSPKNEIRKCTILYFNTILNSNTIQYSIG